MQERPKPPSHLAEGVRSVWTETVGSLPPDWFTAETLPLLEMYCSHVAMSRILEQKVQDCMAEKISTDDLGPQEIASLEALRAKGLKSLRDMYEKETRAAYSYATKLRFTLQATYDKSKKKKSPNDKLWNGAAN